MELISCQQIITSFSTQAWSLGSRISHNATHFFNSYFIIIFQFLHFMQQICKIKHFCLFTTQITLQLSTNFLTPSRSSAKSFPFHTCRVPFENDLKAYLFTPQLHECSSHSPARIHLLDTHSHPRVLSSQSGYSHCIEERVLLRPSLGPIFAAFRLACKLQPKLKLEKVHYCCMCFVFFKINKFLLAFVSGRLYIRQRIIMIAN